VNGEATEVKLMLAYLLMVPNHYTMMFEEFGKQVANTIDDLLLQVR
jgi:hypothetical protein